MSFSIAPFDTCFLSFSCFYLVMNGMVIPSIFPLPQVSNFESRGENFVFASSRLVISQWRMWTRMRMRTRRGGEGNEKCIHNLAIPLNALSYSSVVEYNNSGINCYCCCDFCYFYNLHGCMYGRMCLSTRNIHFTISHHLTSYYRSFLYSLFLSP